RWPALHIIGKDILVPAHGIYWLIMLHAIGFPDEAMPQLLVHGWWNLGGAKMSKSAGNIIDPFVLAEKYGVDALRYYLMSDIATGKDADFSEERLVERFNADLANSLGNLLNRTLNMAQQYFGGRLQQPKVKLPYVETLRRCLFVVPEYYKHSFGDEVFKPTYQVATALALVFGNWQREDDEEGELAKTFDGLGVTHCNRLIDKIAPWKIAK